MNIRDRTKELRRVRAGDLVPNPKNWRKHPESQQNALRGVLAEIGYADALIVRELPDGRLMIVDGHLRAETTPDQIVPVLVVDLTEAEADKLLATLDPLAAMATADPGKLDALLREIQTESEAVAAMLTELAEVTSAQNDGAGAAIGDTEVALDKADELQAKWKTEIGQTWAIGEHLVYCGSCFDWQRRCDVVCTDPPYDLDVETMRSAIYRFGDVAAVLCTGKQAFSFCRDGWRYARDLCWTHSQPRSIAWTQPIYYHANVIVATFGSAKSGWKRPYPAYGSLLDFPYEDKLGFGQGKSPRLFERILEGFAEAKTVADPFAGTLAVLVAAHLLNKQFVGCELDPKHLAVGLERCASLRPNLLRDKDLARYNAGQPGVVPGAPKRTRSKKETAHV